MIFNIGFPSDFKHPNLVPLSYTLLATALLLQPETATALTGGEWLLPLTCLHVVSPLSLTARIVAIKVASSQASQATTCKPPVHVSAAHIQHNKQVAFLCRFEQVTLFFLFFPPSSCALLPAPDNPCASLRALTSRIRSAHAVASLDKHCPPHPPPNHATTSAPIAICILSLPHHPRMPPCTPTPKPHTCMTHAWPVELSIFVWVSPFFVFFFLFLFYCFFFFFFSPVHLCTLLTHIQTPSSCAPTLAWPEGKTVVPSQGLNDGDGPGCITHPCSTHGFCMWPAVGMRLTTLFDPQRDLELAVA